MLRPLSTACLRLLAQEASSVCRACGRPLVTGALRRPKHARASHSRRVQRTSKAEALSSRGNPDVMRKFQALQQGEDDLDDFEIAEQAAQDDEFDDEQGLAGAEPGFSRKAAQLDQSDLPPPRNSKVKSSRYVTSAVTLESCPKPKFPEFAVIGRSNVGKSSLINLLTQNKGLALVSKQPGKTKCINHFLINDSWWLVDLPGYGYAKSAKDDRLKWNDFTRDYFLRRETLVMVLLLIDASIPPQAVDLECASWMLDSEVPFCVVFTKADKRKKGVAPPAQNVGDFLAALQRDAERLPDSFVTSAADNVGRGDVLNHLASLRQLFDRLYE